MTAVVFSFMNGIVHPYYTVALAPAIAALVGIGATLLWQNRSALPAATALAGIVLVTSILACVLLARTDGWLPWLRAVVAVGGVAAAVLLLVVGSAEHDGRAFGGAAWPSLASLGSAGRVFRCDGGHPAHRRDTVGRARRATGSGRWGLAAC